MPTKEILELIYKSPVLMGAQRLLDNYADYAGKKLIIKNAEKNKLADMVEILKNENQDAVVLASGDPLFFGVGGYLISRFSSPEYIIEIYPGISSMQLAFARAGISWQDAKCLSLHGRPMQGLAQRLEPENKIAILTDFENHPGKIAAYMLHFNLGNYRAFVAENLGMKNERTAWYSPEELSKKVSEDFLELNVLILIKDTTEEGKNISYSIGIPDEQFSYPEKPEGLITKKEIRTLSLGEMRLKADSVVWDIGSCTGSIAIEAAKIARQGVVYAIEKNQEHLAYLRLNVKKFHTDICIIEKEAPDGLTGLKDPDVVFIGGSGGRLREILDVCADRLRPSGRIMINAATLETMHDSLLRFKELGFRYEIQMAQISRSRPVGNLTRFQALNPVFILTACRNNDS